MDRPTSGNAADRLAAGNAAERLAAGLLDRASNLPRGSGLGNRRAQASSCRAEAGSCRAGAGSCRAGAGSCQGVTARRGVRNGAAPSGGWPRWGGMPPAGATPGSRRATSDLRLVSSGERECQGRARIGSGWARGRWRRLAARSRLGAEWPRGQHARRRRRIASPASADSRTERRIAGNPPQRLPIPVVNGPGRASNATRTYLTSIGLGPWRVCQQSGSRPATTEFHWVRITGSESKKIASSCTHWGFIEPFAVFFR
jgi:hypothetical protein